MRPSLPAAYAWWFLRKRWVGLGAAVDCMQARSSAAPGCEGSAMRCATASRLHGRNSIACQCWVATLSENQPMRERLVRGLILSSLGLTALLAVRTMHAEQPVAMKIPAPALTGIDE